MGRENGVWVEFYSTPFVFLTDTFTGKFLCGRDVGRGHFLRNDVSVVSCGLVPRRCGNVQPHMGVDIVLDDALSVVVHPTQIVLGRGIPLFGSKSVPLHRSLIVLWNTLSVVVQQPRLY